jgi:hypothetical protein
MLKSLEPVVVAAVEDEVLQVQTVLAAAAVPVACTCGRCFLLLLLGQRKP